MSEEIKAELAPTGVLRAGINMSNCAGTLRCTPGLIRRCGVAAIGVRKMTVLDRLTQRLEAANLPFKLLHHDPVYTSEEAARVRGTSLASGAKALICKGDGRFMMFVMPADRRLASRQIRKRESIRSLRFASREEVAEMTGLQPGSIPPFGSLFDLPTFCDAQLSEQPVINFNAGDHSVSISMAYTDFATLEAPTLGPFAE